jgi:hypothetical protein
MMNLVLTVAVCLAQDAQVLQWKVQEGQAFTATWKMELKVVDPENPGVSVEMKIDIAAALKVRKAAKEEATFDLTVTKYAMKGSYLGRPTELHYEDGAVLRPDPAGPAGLKLKGEVEKPGQLKVDSRGIYSFPAAHLIKPFFDGRSDFLGCQLPSRAVKAGDTWEGEVETSKAREKGMPPMKVRYTLKETAPDLARVTMDERQDFSISSGRTFNLRAASESEFNIAGGYCSKSTITVDGYDKTGRKGAPESPDFASVMTFELKPIK